MLLDAEILFPVFEKRGNQKKNACNRRSQKWAYEGMFEPHADSGNKQYVGGFTPVLFGYKYIFCNILFFLFLEVPVISQMQCIEPGSRLIGCFWTIILYGKSITIIHLWNERVIEK